MEAAWASNRATIRVRLAGMAAVAVVVGVAAVRGAAAHRRCRLQSAGQGPRAE